jgi:hypothetical protein
MKALLTPAAETHQEIHIHGLPRQALTPCQLLWSVVGVVALTTGQRAEEQAVAWHGPTVFRYLQAHLIISKLGMVAVGTAVAEDVLVLQV